MALNQDWASLARQVKERRTDLGMTQEDVAGSGGPSTATVRLIENQGAESYKQKTYRQLETALRLRPGSVRAALQGGLFQPLEAEEIPPGLADSYNMMREWLEMMNNATPAEREAERARIRERLNRGSGA